MISFEVKYHIFKKKILKKITKKLLLFILNLCQFSFPHNTEADKKADNSWQYGLKLCSRVCVSTLTCDWLYYVYNRLVCDSCNDRSYYIPCGRHNFPAISSFCDWRRYMYTKIQCMPNTHWHTKSRILGIVYRVRYKCVNVPR